MNLVEIGWEVYDVGLDLAGGDYDVVEAPDERQAKWRWLARNDQGINFFDRLQVRVTKHRIITRLVTLACCDCGKQVTVDIHGIERYCPDCGGHKWEFKARH